MGTQEAALQQIVEMGQGIFLHFIFLRIIFCFLIDLPNTILSKFGSFRVVTNVFQVVVPRLCVCENQCSL